MIHDVKELSASLRYASGWADTLEGLRRHSEATDATLLPTTSAGPLAELRRVIMEAREFVEALPQSVTLEESTDYRLPVQGDVTQTDVVKVA